MKSTLSLGAAAAALVLPVFSQQAKATITVAGYYHLGESDSGAVIAGPGASTTVDSSGNGHDLTIIGATPTYVAAPTAATLTTSSTIGLAFNGSTSFYTGGRPTSATDNIGLEGFFTPAVVKAGGQSNLALLGNGGADGVGLCINDGNYKIFFPGQGYLDTGVAAAAGVPVYFAYVRSAGENYYFLNDATQVDTHNTSGFGNGTNAFDIGSDGDTYTGAADEVRVFTFTAGDFKPSDLLISQSPVPEPTSVGLLASSGLLLLRRRRNV